jgi:hypothetical protein
MAPAAVPAGIPIRIADELQGVGDAVGAAEFARVALAAVRASGLSANAHLAALPSLARDHPAALADCAHLLMILHGHAPSLFELTEHGDRSASGWHSRLRVAFDDDRRWLARLAALTGSALDLYGLSIAEQRVREQRDAMLTLARSSRAGCALGAAATLALDWSLLRDTLGRAATGAGIDCRDLSTPDWPGADAEAMLAAACEAGSTRRAVVFGLTQMASLHAQVFALIEARHSARLS